ncbi:MAG: NDP-sugar synthase [Clostridia bacterium]|nr:NDP-sugar synthase [Clostridia bacterium]
MDAVILCGGFGKRLAPLTNELPKPMLSVANRPMLDYCFAQLSAHKIFDVTLTLAFMPEKIIEWVSGYSDFSLKYSIEQNPLGTAGGVKNAAKHLGEVFAVISGDGLSDVNLSDMLATHIKSGADVTMAVTQSETPWLYGVVEHSDGYVKEFFEKPKDAFGKRWINTGVYIINKCVLDYVPDNAFFDFSKDLFPLILANGKIGVYKHIGYWNDIGDIVSYHRANMDMISGGLYPFAHNDRSASSELYGSNELSLVSNSASVAGRISRSVIGKRCRICSSSVIRECVVLDGVTVKGRHNNCIISNSAVLPLSEYTVSENAKIFKKSLR